MNIKNLHRTVFLLLQNYSDQAVPCLGLSPKRAHQKTLKSLKISTNVQTITPDPSILPPDAGSMAEGINIGARGLPGDIFKPRRMMGWGLAGFQNSSTVGGRGPAASRPSTLWICGGGGGGRAPPPRRNFGTHGSILAHTHSGFRGKRSITTVFAPKAC